MLNLLRLSHLTGETQWGEMAWELARSSAGLLATQPAGYAMLLSSLDYGLGPSMQIALVGRSEDAAIIEMLSAIRERFLPHKSVLLVQGEETKELAEFARDLGKIAGKSAAYVCTGESCSPAVASPVELIRLLDGPNAIMDNGKSSKDP